MDITDISTCPEGETSKIFISRFNVLEDATQEILALSNLRDVLEVNFYGEIAMDYGGPRKKFFRLAQSEIAEMLCSNDTDNQAFTLKDPDPEKLMRKSYYIAGIILGLSVIEGGEAAPFLQHVVTCEGEHMDQVRLGLKRVGLLQLMDIKPTLRLLFKPRTNSAWTVSRVLTILTPDFSPPGSNRRVMEEESYRTFVSYIRDVAAGRRGNVTMDSIMRFTTGSDREPILGYSMQPSLSFDADIQIPTASTCINRLNLPQKVSSKERTFELLDLAFVNDYFGLN